MFIGVHDSKIISFGSGQPDLPPPKCVYDILPHYKDFKYGLIQGELALREVLANRYPSSSPEHFVITNGASEALDLTFRVIALLKGNGKQKVLLPRPYYYSYPHIVKYAGLDVEYTDLVKGKIDIEDFKKKIKDCKAVIINSPSNPTGRVEEISTLKEIEKITTELGVYVISDEVYKDLIYGRENYLIEGPHVITINSFSKTYAMCGFRVGYLWSLDRDIVDACIEMKTHSSMNTNILGQEMALAATTTPPSFISEQLLVWKERRDTIYEGLKALGFSLWSPEGAFYVMPKVKNPKQFMLDMYETHRVITYMGDWFGAPDRVRLSYALDKEKIEEGLRRIGQYIKFNAWQIE